MADVDRVNAAIENLRKMGHSDESRLAGFERHALAGRWGQAHAILWKDPICGARRPNGLRCLAGPVNNGRCRCHGGGTATPGPTTKAGRDRIAAAQRERWRRWREARAAAISPTLP